MTRTNLITGFLGCGKTTTIRHLLAQKPENEKWAVLVNEFGEIGIDGALLADSGAVLKEIPGGCMCCVNGLPMQVGLNMLLQQAKPDRLLIEPTGLGHPKQILSLLTSDIYQPWIDLRATVTLLDARQLSDDRYTSNENFRDQLAAADILVANKQDTYSATDYNALQQWHEQQSPSRPLYYAEQGEIDVALLDISHSNNNELPDGAHHHSSTRQKGLAALSLKGTEPWRRALNKGQGYLSCGWVFNADTVFDTVPLLEWVRLNPVERVKGVMRIAEGTLVINRQGNDLQIETRQIPPLDSRIELISANEADWNALQHQLLNIRLTKGV
ncbi:MULTISPECIES: GTP-binding protein [Yersinia]|uniref:CobW family GTP-binding protein n=1 Tax=Yersinia TaxID=629 RepID=UPI0005E35448|nr:MULTISPECIES: GTP-binding protein [Yersinia]OVZ97915.1 GTP-binding protein [Yersinia frederiksenii]RXA98364.1 GTP-binding protein [Yersinia sp. 2105 StPb PI]CNH85862.1 putative cobalamin synthesis protein [Yersinia frederiksenii]CNI15725.1 putative cobalamin synthesis protein [Yersinia frederiksenii]CNK00485.1 putative cobalamin synthesis protein [Yersinia frederiksenii]